MVELRENEGRDDHGPSIVEDTTTLREVDGIAVGSRDQA
jgi:hypothetical protein